MMHWPARIAVVEVAPRDGLQSFHRWVDTQTKIAMIDRLSELGFPVIEAGSFSHPNAVPLLRDGEDVFRRIRRRPGTLYRALVPNAKGAERAVACGVDEVLGLITVSEAYTQKNQRMSVAAAAEQACKSFEIADKAGLRFVMALGMAFWCAYEGRIAEERVLRLVARFYAAGMRRFYLAGSVGMEDPRHVNGLFQRIREQWPDIEVGYHVHNLSGAGTANLLAALDAGASQVEGSICGIGGGMTMPSSLGAVGNLPTEDIVHLLNESGVDTGIDTQAIQQAARDIAAMLEIEPRSYVTRNGTRLDVSGRAAIHAADSDQSDRH
jgi:hydroxymethylglutaryl-CoA lyase